jgi:hypothetical protein
MKGCLGVGAVVDFQHLDPEPSLHTHQTQCPLVDGECVLV